MAENRTPNWREEIEAILREKYQGDELQRQLKAAFELSALALKVEIPSGDNGKVVALILKHASEQLYPLAAVYAGFQWGAAYERYQNANRIRKP